MRIDRPWLERTLSDLVRVPSVNPAFSDGASDEREIAAAVADLLRPLGCEVELREPAPGRVSVIGRRPGSGGGPSLLLYAHLDTVGVEGMADPFSGEIREGRLYGRGSYDMKAGLAACLAAVKALADGGVALAGDLLVAAVADEEAASVGIEDVLTAVSPDAAIVTEPTELELCLAHKGFVWVEVVTHGRAAHGSRFEEGIDANIRMGRFLARLEGLERELRTRPSHPLVGPPSLHAGVLRGGTGPSTYADRCRLEIERRTIPGESVDEAVAEIRAIADALAAEDPAFRADVTPLLARGPHEADSDRPVVRAVAAAAARVLGRSPPVVGRPYWMDAALLGEAGVETVVFGHGGGGAHAAEEWADLASVAALAEILALAAAEACGRR